MSEYEKLHTLAEELGGEFKKHSTAEDPSIVGYIFVDIDEPKGGAKAVYDTIDVDDINNRLAPEYALADINAEHDCWSFDIKKKPLSVETFVDRYNALTERSETYKMSLSTPHAIMQFFVYEHLPEHLHVASKPFCELAEYIDRHLPNNPEKDRALIRLLEAKDCAVRAKLFK